MMIRRSRAYLNAYAYKQGKYLEIATKFAVLLARRMGYYWLMICLDGRLCALKEVEHDRTMPTDLIKQAREQFLREATILARLDHPNLPKVSDFFSISGRDTW